MKFFFTRLFFALITLLSITTAVEAKEELTVIQTVSKDRRSFVVAKGLKDGLIKGQEIVFANDNVSVVCKASLVDRDYSLWVPLDRKVTVPFNKEEIVSANSTVYGNVALQIIGSPNALGFSRDTDQDYKDFIKSNNFALKASYNRGLSQSSSSVSEEKSSGRTGYNFSLEYNYRFMPQFEVSGGVRMDNEVYRISDPELDIPTTRKMLTVAATYHLLELTDDRNNFYLTLAAGIGTSSTTVDGEVASGRAVLLPEVRVGYLFPFSKSKALLAEGSVESISTHETFSDDTAQSSNALNMKFSVGLRF